MRTTFDIDDDLLKQLKELAHKSRVPLRKIVNATLRLGLTESQVGRSKKRYVCPVFDMGKPLVDLDKALALAASMDDAMVIRKIALRK